MHFDYLGIKEVIVHLPFFKALNLLRVGLYVITESSGCGLAFLNLGFTVSWFIYTVRVDIVSPIQYSKTFSYSSKSLICRLIILR